MTFRHPTTATALYGEECLPPEPDSRPDAPADGVSQTGRN